MKLTTLLTPLLLTLTHPTPTTATGPNEMVTKDYQNAITCGKKNADINYLIDLFCTSSAHGTPRESNGFHLGQPAWYNLRFPARNGWRLQIAGPHCPKDQLWVPAKFCEAQFHYMCAHGGPRGLSMAKFGEGGCQTWRIFRWEEGSGVINVHGLTHYWHGG